MGTYKALEPSFARSVFRRLANRSSAAQPALNKLDSIRHFIGFVNLPDEYEHHDDLADALRVHVAVNNPGMRDTSGVQFQEISVLRENEPLQRKGVNDLLYITCMQQPHFRFRGNIDATTPQSLGDRPGQFSSR